MSKIPGKLKAEDVPKLTDLIDGRNVLQLGCYCGRGTLVLARSARHTWVLDDFRYPGGISGVVEELKVNMDRGAPEDSEIDLLYGTAGGWAVPKGGVGLDPADPVEVVYRDADRPEECRDLDEGLALELLRRRGGVYAWHDAESVLRWLRVDPTPVEVN